MKYYAVLKGRKPGLYTSWDEAKQQVSGFSGAKYKSFKSYEDAAAYLGKKPGASSLPKVKKSAGTGQTSQQPLDLAFGDEITVYSDGGSRSHGNRTGEHVKETDKAAWAYLITMADPKQEVSDTGGEYGATNNRMEIMGLLKALTYLVAHHFEKRPITVVSDSKYVLNALTKGWLSNWQRRGWKRADGPLINKELWQQMAEILKKIPDIRYEWTKGHANNDGNVFVDNLLNQTMDQMTAKKEQGTSQSTATVAKVTDAETTDSETAESTAPEVTETTAAQEDEKTAPESAHESKSKRRKIKLDTESLKPSEPAPTHLSPEVEKSVHDVEESLKKLGFYHGHLD